MAKKELVASEVVLEMFEKSRESTPFFRSISDEAFCGYVTAMVRVQNPKLNAGSEEVMDVVMDLFRKGKL